MCVNAPHGAVTDDLNIREHSKRLADHFRYNQKLFPFPSQIFSNLLSPKLWYQKRPTKTGPVLIFLVLREPGIGKTRYRA